MKFKIVFYILFALLFSLLVFTLAMQPRAMWVYLVCELMALAMTVVMYFALVRPVSSILLGMDLIKGQDFGSRLAKVGQLDAEKLVDLFNTMMASIKNERVYRQEQNYFMEQLINASPLGIITLDLEGKISQVNDAAVKMLGAGSHEEILYRDPGTIDSPLARSLSLLSDGETRTVRFADTMIYRCSSLSFVDTLVYRCSSLSFVDTGFHRRFFLVESLTDEVMEAEKQTYEKVIRMIAHEVNNTMTGVSSLLEAVAAVFEASDEELCEALGSCRERIESLSAFITSYANLVRIPPLQLEAVDINEQLMLNMPFLESIGAPRGVKLTAHLTDKPVPAAIDRVLMEQVIVNVVKNAVESIGHDGEVTISTLPGSLTITDNGAGISPEAASHLFSPFYSTKPDGQGLGLMFVNEVLRRHGFRFSLATDPADGLTRFTIHF